VLVTTVSWSFTAASLPALHLISDCKYGDDFSVFIGMNPKITKVKIALLWFFKGGCVDKNDFGEIQVTGS
jgi:hypothetical protein